MIVATPDARAAAPAFLLMLLIAPAASQTLPEGTTRLAAREQAPTSSAMPAASPVKPRPKLDGNAIATARALIEAASKDPAVRQRLRDDAALISAELNKPGTLVSGWLDTTLQAYKAKGLESRLTRNSSSWSALVTGLPAKVLGGLKASASRPADSSGPSTPLSMEVGAKQDQVAVALAANAAAQDALDGTVSNDPEQLAEVMETIIHSTRPVILVCANSLWFTARSSPYSDALKPSLQAISNLAQATGLIVLYDRLPDGSLRLRSEVATGVAVAGRRLVTNLHVLINSTLAFRDPLSQKWTMPTKIVAKVLFPYQYENCSPAAPRPIEAVVTGVVTTGTASEVGADAPDFAVLQLDRDAPTTVSFASNDMVSGDRLVAVGYPSRPDEARTFLTTAQIDSIFGAPDNHAPFPAERASYGMRAAKLGDQPGMFTHDASTWGGNSGSGILSLQSGAVVGLQAKGLESRTEALGYNLAVDGAVIASALTRLSK